VRAAAPRDSSIGTALILAAGTGTRLSPLTDNSHKCLARVNGVPILGRQLSALERWGFDRLVIVVGHAGQRIRDYVARRGTRLKVEYIENPRYATTNNIYSLWLARDLVDEPFVLLECDLFFETRLIGRMLRPDTIAVAKREPWMQGTTVSLDSASRVAAFRLGGASGTGKFPLKTVNIYSLSLRSWHQMARRLDDYVTQGRVNEYYEVVFRDMVDEGVLSLFSVLFDNGCWYEIDTPDDLRAAEEAFKSRGVLSAASASHSIPLIPEHG